MSEFGLGGLTSMVMGIRRAISAAAGGGGAEATYENLTALGCVAFWPLNEGSGTVATDVIGGADGTYVGATHGTELVAGAGSAASFDGTDDYIDISAFDLSTMDGLYEMSIEITFNIGSKVGLTPYLYTLYAHSVSTSNAVPFLWMPSQSLQSNWDVLTGGDGSAQQKIYASEAAMEGLTLHVVAVWDGNTGTGRLYIDGSIADTDVNAADIGALSVVDGANKNVLGASGAALGTATNHLDGSISHFGIYNRALSASEVSDRYNNRAPEDPTYDNLEAMGCVAFWPLTEGSGEVATDVIGGADGTYVGATHGAELVAGAGSAANFDGVNDYITLTAMFSMQDSGLGDAFSVEVTFQGLDEGRDFSLVDMRDGAGDPVDGFAIHLDPANTIDGHRFHDTGNVELNAATPWKSVTRHAVLTYSQATGTLTLYIDGVSQVVDNTTASLDNSSVFSPSENNRLGISGAGGGLFKGRMSHVGVYNKELTASEVTDRYNNRAPS